jgi:hypothetical protein
MASENKDSEGLINKFPAYITVSRRYVKEQTDWLVAAKSLIERWDHQFFLPEYVKLAGRCLVDRFEADVEATSLTIEMYEDIVAGKTDHGERKKRIRELRDREAKAIRQYDDLSQNIGKLHWRQLFI